MSRKDPEINPRQMRFVEEYLKHGNGTQAAIAAGYSKKSAKRIASDLLNNFPAVKAAMDKAREQSTKKAQYNLESAMEELDSCIVDAKAARQFTAVANMLQTKAKLNGLLIEKLHMQIEPINITAALAAARARAFPLPEITDESESEVRNPELVFDSQAGDIFD